MRTIRLAAPLLGLGVILAACSSGGSAATAAPTTAPSVAAPSVGASPSAAAASIALAKTSLGTVLVDGKGLTLYEFAPDGAGTSACSGDCADNWPPLAGAGAPTVGTGLTAGDFTSITRDDGSSQVAFKGHPLYYFKGDTAAGDTKGQGLGGKWYVVGADGSMIGANAASPSASAAAGTTVNLTTNALGKIITDASGKTLYLFTPDSGNKSVCNGDCAASWPPLFGAATPGAGLDAEDFGTITRDDGKTQATFYGHPLYYFAGDAAAGDTKGQGLGGKWYVLDSEGKAIK
jgi:predicted lipoprotein with Yx(FWY)xxD motif